MELVDVAVNVDVDVDVGRIWLLARRHTHARTRADTPTNEQRDTFNITMLAKLS